VFGKKQYGIGVVVLQYGYNSHEPDQGSILSSLTVVMSL